MARASGRLWSGVRVGRTGATVLAIAFALCGMVPPSSGGPSDAPAAPPPAAAPPSAPPPAAAPPVTATRADPARIVYPTDRTPMLALPQGGAQPVHSVLNVRRMLAFGDYVWNEAGVAPGRLFIRVDLDRQLVSVFRGGHEIGTALVLYGTPNNPTPRGMLNVLGKVEHYRSHKYGVPMEYTLWLTGDGIAIHASDMHAGYATRGCIGVPIGFAHRLFGATRVGDRVGIVTASRIA